MDDVIKTIIQLVAALGLGGGGGWWFFKTTKRDKEVDITAKLETIYTTLLERQKEDNASQYSTILLMRQYLINDSRWHREVIKKLDKAGIEITDPPTLPLGW